MSEMVERVASAILLADLKWRKDPGPHLWGETIARSAIEAMREPTAKMQNVFYAIDEVGAPTGSYAGWKAMIDEALK